MRKFLLIIFFTMFPVLAHGATYYVAKMGSDSNSCANAQSQSTPKLTINAGAGCLRAGDTLIVKAGTYEEVLLNVIPSGTSSAPTTVKSEVPRGAMLHTTQAGSDNWCTICITNRSYITIDGLVLDGSNMGHMAHVYLNGTTDHIIIQNNDIRHGLAQGHTTDNPMGIADNHQASFITVRGNKIHDIGDGAVPGSNFYSYGIYLHFNNSVIENNEIYNCAGFGIHMYNTVDGDAANNIIRNNKIHHNGIPSGENGVLFASGGNNNTMYNNIIYSNAGHGIQVGGYGVGSNNNTVYNNTLYANGGNCVRIGSSYGGPSNTTVRNNICYQNGSDTVSIANGSGNTIDHNLLGTDPRFVNVPAQDYNLQAGSPAIDAGVVVPGLSYNGPAPDLGALEAGAGVPPPINLRYKLIVN